MQNINVAKIVRQLTAVAAGFAAVLLATGVAVAASMRADAELPMLSPELGDMALATGLLAACAAIALLAIGLLVRPASRTI